MASEPVSADQERQRLEPVLADVVSLGIPVSIDSMKSAVVGWALDAGAAIANDVWGLQRDPDMAALLAARGSPVIVMHNRDRADPGIDIMQDIAAFFARSIEIATKAGISRENIVLDPGIGFGKTPEQSMIALARLARIRRLRPAAAGRRVAQALHQFGHAVGAASAARRLDRGASDCRGRRRAHHPDPRRGGNRAGAARGSGNLGQAMTDMIFITGVVIHARHGVMEHETEVGQRFVIDLELSTDLSESSRTDRLADTVSYSNVVATATAAFKDANYKLLERAAGAVADAILATFPRIAAVKVTVHKPHAPIAAIFEDVGVVLTRTRQAPSHG